VLGLIVASVSLFSARKLELENLFVIGGGVLLVVLAGSAVAGFGVLRKADSEGGGVGGCVSVATALVVGALLVCRMILFAVVCCVATLNRF